MRPAPPRSLGLRLVLVLLAAQVIAVVVWLLLLMLVSPYLSYDEPAALTSRAHVARSLERSEDGWVFSATDLFKAYVERRPGLEYLAADRAGVIVASTPRFAQEMGPILPLLARGGELHAASGSVVRASAMTVDDERLLIVTRGDRFGRDDLPRLMSAYVAQLLLMFAPALLAAVIVAPLAVRRALRGLRGAARAAAAIDLGSLDRRLDPRGAPLEAASFVEAINRLLERVQEGVRRREMFVANAAHELRTPVAVLSARVGGLEEGSARDALQADIRRLAVLIDQLLAAARLHGDDRLAFEPVDVADVVRNLVADMAPLALRSGRALAFAGPETAWSVGDAEALRSAIANLVDNALRSAPPGGVVNAEVRSGADALEVRVVDQGPGVPASDREAVFEPFWRGRSHGAGAGLGLAIVRTVARAHGGRVRLDDTVGGGATFVLSLPAARVRH